jgi:hypothetical protein
MAKPFDKVLGGKRNIVLLGEAGCGKSEIALNLAVRLSRDGPVHFFDMDQTKPLYRSRDARRALEARGVSFFCQEQYMDAPTLVGGVAESLRDESAFTILDVGGNDTGARMIGGFSRLINGGGTVCLYVVNPYRPWSKDVDAVDGTLSSILRVSHIQKFHIISNPNLGFETTAEEFAAGIEKTRRMLEQYVPVEGACAREEIFDTASGLTELPLLPLRLYLKYEWND